MPALSLVSYSAGFVMYKIITPLVDLAEGGAWPITIDRQPGGSFSAVTNITKEREK